MIKNLLFLKNNKGFSIIEALIGVTIGGLLLMAFSSLIYQTIKINQVNSSQIKATMYLQEMIEVVKDLEREPGWNEINNCLAFSNCHPMADGNNWRLLNGDETLEENFTRHLVITPVSRDPGTESIELVYNPVNDDPDTRFIRAIITWNNGFEMRTAQLETYVYKY